MAPPLSCRESLRWRVIQASMDCEKRHRCSSTRQCVAQNVGTSRQLVARWVARHSSGQSMHDRPRSGAPCKMSPAATAKAKACLQDIRAGLTLSKMATKLVHEGDCPKGVSASTVRRAVQSGKNPLVSRHVTTRPAITAAQQEKRVAFARKYRRESWKKYCFSDSKYFYLSQMAGKKGPKRWVLEGTKPTQPVVKYPAKLHVYAGVTAFGKTDLHFASGTTGLVSGSSETKRGVGAQEYQSILRETLLPQARKIFQHRGIQDWTFQQDGAPAHTAKSTKAFFESSGVKLLPDWPANSPDLSWIENIWGWTEVQLRKQQFNTLAEFRTALEEVWQNMPLKVLQDNCKSMRTRLQVCLERNGEYTGY